MGREDFEALEEAKKEAREPVESGRFKYALNKISKLYKVERGGKALYFYFKGAKITFWPYTGWASGKTIEDGRGIRNLLSQIKEG